MTAWRIVREWRFQGPGEAGADAEGGLGFALERTETREERQLSVEVARGGSGVATSRLRELVRNYLDDPELPRRIIVDRDGNVVRVVPDQPDAAADQLEAAAEGLAQARPVEDPQAALAGDPGVDWDDDDNPRELGGPA